MPQDVAISVPDVIDLASYDAALDTLAQVGEGTKALIVFEFEGSRESIVDSYAAHLEQAVANLPQRDCIAMGFANGPLCGRDLSLFLRCSLPFAGPDARFEGRFGAAGSAAVYAAAAHRIGAAACERLLFGRAQLDAGDAAACALVLPARDRADAVAQALARFSTMMPVAKANLITWPYPLTAAQALVDP